MNCRDLTRMSTKGVSDDECEGTLTRTREDEWIIFTCDLCGLERVGHERKWDERARNVDRLQRAGIPQRFLGQRYVEDDDNRDALNAVRAWLNEESLLPAPALCSLPGRGKSHLLSALSARLIKARNISVKFCSARGLLAELQDYEGDYRGAWERATTVEVLAIDDLGAQRDTDDKHERLADLIDKRYEAELPIMVATNYRPSAWDARAGLDSRSISRLRSMTFAVELRGGDRRQMALGVAA